MATTEGERGSMVSTKETAEMERSIAALALELPAEVWEDVRDRWHAARDSMERWSEQTCATLAEDLRKTKEERDRLLPFIIQKCPKCGLVSAPEEDGFKVALTKLVERIWAEFGTDLTEGDNDHLDAAYVEACVVLGIAPDPRTDEQKAETEDRYR